jgi:hypothetical protein
VRILIAVLGSAWILGGALPLPAQEPGRFARIALLRPHEGKTVDFESGYVRHLDWHRQAGDPWTWYGWTITYGDRQRWFVYATFGHRIEDFDNSVSPAEDERDNVRNVVPHAEFAGNGLFEFLPGLSRGTGVPTPAARLEMTTYEVAVGTQASFESALAAGHSALTEETLWYRLVAGGPEARYVRLRPRASIAAIVASQVAPASPKSLTAMITAPKVEILTLQPTMSFGLPRK